MIRRIGDGPAEDRAAAVAWFRKAAEQGNAEGQNRLGHLYHDGRGVARDEVEATKWWKRAAEQGDASAQYWVGSNYELGMGGLPRDLAAAERWYRKSAEQGIAEAQTSLGETTVPFDGPVQRPFCPGELLSMSLTDAGIVEVMAVFRQVSGFPILGLEQETRPVTVNVDEVSWEAALTETLKGLGYRWAREGDAIRVTPSARPAG